MSGSHPEKSPTRFREDPENQNDLEAVPLPFSDDQAHDNEIGTTITLSYLDDRLNFPTSDRLRDVLIYEYGREDTFKVFVDDIALSVQDVPGDTTRKSTELPNAGKVSLDFTIAEGKRAPRSPGIILKVDGKVVGKPSLFGRDEDGEIPEKLAKRVYGEINLTGLENYVTADWGGVIENSKAFQEARAYVVEEVKKELKTTHAHDMSLQKARLQKKVNQRLQKLPEYRRQYAEQALYRILSNFYGETDERIETIVDVALDAMEHDAYWAVLNRINDSSHKDVSIFAESLRQFGLLELSNISAQADHRLRFLDYLDQLIQKPEAR